MTLDKSRKQLIITGILVLALVFISINTFSNSKKGKREKAKKQNARVSITQEAPSGGSGDISVQKTAMEGFAPLDHRTIQLQLVRIAEEEPIKDPFYPMEKKETFKRGSIVLKGISWKEKAPSFAIINEQIIKVGDSVGDSKVLRIEEKSVVLEKDNREYILVLEE